MTNRTFSAIAIYLIILCMVGGVQAQSSESERPAEIVCPDGAPDEICVAFMNGTCPFGSSIEACESKLNAEDKEKDFFSKFVKFISPTLRLITEILVFLTAAVILLLQKQKLLLQKQKLLLQKQKVSTLLSRLGDPIINPIIKGGKPVRFDTRGVNLLVVGEGGSGKTSIIRALSGSPHAEPSRATQFPTTYSIAHEIDVKSHDGNRPKRTLERIYANDYKGQDADQLIKSNELKKREESIPSTILLIVVDLFEVKTEGQTALNPSRTFDSDRVQTQIEAYPQNLLDILYGLPSTLDGVILFINKIDKIRPLSRYSEDRVKKAFDELIIRLRLRSARAGCEFYVIVGSAVKGLGICGFDPYNKNEPTLYELLKRAMVEIDVQCNDLVSQQ